MSGPGLHPFDLNAARGAGINNALNMQQFKEYADPNSIRNQLVQQQLTNAQNVNQGKDYTLGPGQSRFGADGTMIGEAQPFKSGQDEQQTRLYRNLVNAGLTPGTPPFNERMLEFMGKTNVTINTGDLVQTKGRTKLDQTFAAEYSDLIASGGFADIVKQINQLKGVSKQLETSDTLSGPWIGSVPVWLQTFINPKAVAAKEDIEEVVQRNLRLILGAQFTEKEGERLIARAYNPRLEESVNKIRVDRLIKQMVDAAEAKIAAAKYFGEHGTLTGFTGKLWTIDDFDLDDGDSQSGSMSDSEYEKRKALLLQ